MLEDSKLKTTRKKDAHKLQDVVKYLDDLANLGGFDPLPDYYKHGYYTWSKFMKSHLNDFRDYRFKIKDDNSTIKIYKP